MKNYTSHITKKLLFTVVFLCFYASAQAYSCKAHIYNQSQQPWVFSKHGGSGNVHFAGCPKNGPCEIAASKTEAITYTQTKGATSGNMTVTDYKNVSHTFHFYGTNKCPFVAGDIYPAIRKNQPQDGDFTIISDAWETVSN